MHSDAATVTDYVLSLPEPRRSEIERTLEIVRPAPPEGLAESMDYGMITWSVPLTVEPDTYNGKPLMFGALASQKNTISLYLMTIYTGMPMTEDEFRMRWAGPKKLNMGRSCVRYKAVDDLDVPLIVESLQVPVQTFIAAVNESRQTRRSK